MAPNMTKISTFHKLMCRGLATCQPAPVGGTVNYNVKNTTLPNNLVVSSADNESPLSRISIVFRAGSRYESYENLGITHTLRACAGLSTKNTSQFAITRNIQQSGASVRCIADRETIAYVLEGTRDSIEKTLPFLTEIATQQIFKPWEVADVTPRIKLDLALRSPQLYVFDLLHNAAFRNGLDNPLFTPKYQVGKISSETLQHYVRCNFTTGRGAVAGLGVEHSQLVDYAQSLALETGDGSQSQSKYEGGEIRSVKGGDLAFVAIAGEGAALKNPKEVIAFAVLQRALGVGSQIKYATNDNGALRKAIGTGVSSEFSLAAINASYTDTGIFGAIIAALSPDAGKVVDAVVKVLKAGQLSDADVNRGKNQLKASIILDNESGTHAIERIGGEAALAGSAQSVAQIAEIIDSVSTSDVNNALKKVSSSKLSMASVGDLRTVPYLEQLK